MVMSLMDIRNCVLRECNRMIDNDIVHDRTSIYNIAWMLKREG